MEYIGPKEIRVVVFGEIISGSGFDPSCPISVQFFLDLPNGWTKDKCDGNEESYATQASNAKKGVAHFSHPFFYQLAVSTDTLGTDNYTRPQLLFSVVGTDGKLLRDEGYGAQCIPSYPGNYLFHLRTWKPAPRNITDRLKNLYLGISPSILDPKPLLTGSFENRDAKRINTLGLETEPSGSLFLRLRILHQSEEGVGGIQREKLLLLEKMNSSTGILKTVQAVIEAFQKARKQAAATTSSLM